MLFLFSSLFQEKLRRWRGEVVVVLSLLGYLRLIIAEKTKTGSSTAPPQDRRRRRSLYYSIPKGIYTAYYQPSPPARDIHVQQTYRSCRLSYICVCTFPIFPSLSFPSLLFVPFLRSRHPPLLLLWWSGPRIEAEVHQSSGDFCPTCIIARSHDLRHSLLFISLSSLIVHSSSSEGVFLNFHFNSFKSLAH